MDIHELRRKKSNKRRIGKLFVRKTLSPNDSYTKQNILVSFIIICFSNDNINDANVRKKKGRFIEIYIFFFNMEYYGQNTWSS